MTYGNIHELPSQVTSSLDDADAMVWMYTFNKANPVTKAEVAKAKRDAWHACKSLPSSFSFRIKASVDAIDKDRDVLDLDSVKKHLDSFIDYGGNIQWEHGNYNVGTAWDWQPFTKDDMDGVEVWGNLFGGDHIYDQVRKSFVQGKNSFSVAGEATPGKFQCDTKGCYTRRDVRQLLEISLCAVPSNKYCTLSWYNDGAKFTKSDSESEGIKLNIDEYTIHKDYTECPLMGLKKSLSDAGFEGMHTTYDGVMVPMNFDQFEKDFPVMKSLGLVASWSLNGYATVLDRSYALEKAFKKGFDEGWVDADGRINEKIEKSRFCDLFADGLISETNGEYYIDGAE